MKPNLKAFGKNLWDLVSSLYPEPSGYFLIRLSKYWNEEDARLLAKQLNIGWHSRYAERTVVLMDDERTTCGLSVISNEDPCGKWIAQVKSN